MRKASDKAHTTDSTETHWQSLLSTIGLYYVSKTTTTIFMCVVQRKFMQEQCAMCAKFIYMQKKWYLHIDNNI